MNKIIIIAFAVLAVINSVQCDSSEEILDNIKSKHLKKVLATKTDAIDNYFEKLEKDCPGVRNKFKAAIKTFEECDDNVSDSLTVCSAIQTYALNCTAPLIKVVDDCFEEEFKGLPLLGAKGLVSIAEFLCKQTGESIFELANPCLWEEEGESSEQNIECENKVEELARKYEFKFPNKNELCTAATSLKTCFQRRTNNCKNQKTKDVFIGLFDAALAPCSHLNELK